MDTLEKLKPQTPADLCQIIREARSHHYGVIPCGRGHLVEQLMVPTSRPVKLVSSEKFTRIIDLDVKNLSVKAEAGMTLAELDEILKSYNLFLPLTVESHGHRTLGGLVAEDAAGYESHLYDTVQNHILGLDFVTPYGTLVKTGGKTVKNVSGYDFTRLFARSFGTLGFITAITFKLRPQLEKRTVLLIDGLSTVQDAYRLAKEIKAGKYSLTALRIFRPGEAGAPWKLVVNLGGFAETVTRHLSTLQNLCASYQQHVWEDSQGFWRRYYQEIMPNQPDRITIRAGKGQVWKLADLLSQVVRLEQNYFCDIDLGMGDVHFGAPAKFRLELQQQLVTLGRELALSYSWETPPLDPLYRKLKAALDPDRIMFPCHAWLGGGELD